MQNYEFSSRFIPCLCFGRAKRCDCHDLGIERWWSKRVLGQSGNYDLVHYTIVWYTTKTNRCVWPGQAPCTQRLQVRPGTLDIGRARHP